MRHRMAMITLLLLVVSVAPTHAQDTDKFYAEGYGFWGRRNSSPGTSIAGGGGEVFVFRGLGVARRHRHHGGKP